MKIAWLVLAHTDPHQVLRLVNRLSSEPDWKVFIHVDKRTNIDDFSEVLDQPGVFQTKDRFDVYWGGWSMVKAMNALITETDDSYERYMFLSGLDYPLVSNVEINDFFQMHSADEFIKTVKLSGNKNKYFSNRVTYPWMFDRINMIKKVFNHIFMKLPFPLRGSYFHYKNRKYVIYGGSNFIAFTNEMYKHFVNQLEDGTFGNLLGRRLKNCFAPDEIYFNTLAKYAPFEHKFTVRGLFNKPGLVNVRNLHFFRYDGKYIKTWNESTSDLIEIKKAKLDGDLFIRKVRTGISDELIEMLDSNKF